MFVLRDIEKQLNARGSACRLIAVEPLMDLATGLAFVNSVILVALIFFYAKISVRTRATYSVGLAIFASFLLLHNLLTIFAYVSMAPVFGAGALPFLSAIGAFELAGLIVLLRMTV